MAKARESSTTGLLILKTTGIKSSSWKLPAIPTAISYPGYKIFPANSCFSFVISLLFVQS